MELKLVFEVVINIPIPGSNRTFMELKLKQRCV